MSLINKALSTGWVIAISIVVSVTVWGVASLFFHIPLALSQLGLAGLASIVGGIATIGGIATGLIGLYSLTSINEKIDKAIKMEKKSWQKQLNEEMVRNLRAFSEYNEGTVKSDIREAALCMEKALKFQPELPLAAEHIGMRFSKATGEWAWGLIDRSRNFEFTFNNYGRVNTLSPTQYESNEYRHYAITWLERALLVTGNVPLIKYELAKLYILINDNKKGLSFLKDAIEQDPQLKNCTMRDLGLILWNCREDEEVRTICEMLGKPAILYLSETSLNELLDNPLGYPLGTMIPILGVRRNTITLKSKDSYPTLYDIGKRTSANGNTEYVLQFYEDTVIRLPRENEDPWDAKTLLKVVNDAFVTIGMFRE